MNLRKTVTPTGTRVSQIFSDIFSKISPEITFVSHVLTISLHSFRQIKGDSFQIHRNTLPTIAKDSLFQSPFLLQQSSTH